MLKYNYDNIGNFTKYDGYTFDWESGRQLKEIKGNGKTVVSYAYDSWGKLLGIEGELKDTLGLKNPYRRTKKWVHNTARTVSQKVRNTSHSVVKHTRNFVNNHRRAIEITRHVVAISSIALVAIPLVAPVAIPAMAITSLGLLEIGLDLAVGDNTSAAAGLLCLFPMGKGFKFLKEIGGEAATSGSKAIKITNNFCENENILKKIFNKLSKGEKKLIEEGACFVAGTKIITKDGYKSIENIKIGDKVLSQNVDTGEKEYKEVKNVFVKEVDTLVQIHIEESKIDTTKNHRFWIVDKGWIKAENLKQGEKILLSSGKISIISKVSKQKLKEVVKVYNFEVSDWHTYFVSNIGVLVHNNCMLKPKGAAEARKLPGAVSGGENLADVSRMMRGSNGNAGVIPKEIADNLRGRNFNNFDEFRGAFWQEVGNSKYANEFGASNITRMKDGLAPIAQNSQQYGKIKSYVLHHMDPIHNGGGVYDLDNLRIVTPRFHQEILDKGFHFNK